MTDRVAVTAHRGSSRFAPENTAAAIRLAIEQGADYAEIDVQQTADGTLVLLHDEDLVRTAGLAKKVWEIDSEEVCRLDAGSWHAPEFRGEPVPTLQQIIELARGRIKLNIELKYNRPDPTLAERVVALIDANDFRGECVVSSLDHDAALRVKAVDPELTVGLIVDRPFLDVPLPAIDFLSVHVDLAAGELIRQAHAAGKPVHVWTVDNPRQARRLADLGADNIITNDPPAILAALRT